MSTDSVFCMPDGNGDMSVWRLERHGDWPPCLINISAEYDTGEEMGR